MVWQPKGGNGLHCQSRPGEGITRGGGAEARHGIMRGRFPLRPPRQRLAGAVHVREHAAPCAPWQPGAPARLMVSAPGIVQGARLRGRPAPCGAPACAYPARHNGSYGQPPFRTRTPAWQGALKRPKGPGSGANPDGTPGGCDRAPCLRTCPTRAAERGDARPAGRHAGRQSFIRV